MAGAREGRLVSMRACHAGLNGRGAGSSVAPPPLPRHPPCRLGTYHPGCAPRRGLPAAPCPLPFQERRLQLIQSYQEATVELEEARRLNGELRLASQVSL